MTLLLPALAGAFAVCAMADCPRMQSAARAHDCCEPAPVAVAMDCCGSVAAPAATPAFLDKSSSAAPAVVADFGVAVAPRADLLALPVRRSSPPPLDCLARSCVLRN